MQRVQVESSTLKSVGYDATNSTLELEFVHSAVYRYFAVPAGIHEQLMKAESKGAFFNQAIKDVYPVARV